MSLLAQIRQPADVKALTREELPVLAEEIRRRIIQVTSTNGGHIGPNLGVVELTIALHRVFATPTDRFVFDVAHQGYVHKLLTGRNGPAFDRIRQTDGVSGFLTRNESPHDCFGAGHAGTALSAALGMAVARDRMGTSEHVVAVCGDAAFTCGITLEALNNIAVSTKKLIVVLNDNEWSIDKNVGAIAGYLNELITNSVYNRMHQDMEGFLRSVGGERILRIGSKVKRETKDLIVPSSLFEKLGLRYLGPIDGHDLDKLTQYLEFAKRSDEPVVLHVLTKKGKGYNLACEQPEKFHGTSPFEVATGKGKPTKPGTPPNYQDVFGKTLVKLAKADPTIVGITGAMPSGTGLKFLKDEVPQQYFDVGIAEEHAVLFAAGMATRGLKPVVAIYSTFLQRAYDCIIHDVALQNLPVVFCMDRAGLSPNDGPTHHGLFDIAYLRCVPRCVVMQPKDEDELVDMLWTGLQCGQPAFVRYPRGAGEGTPIKEQPAVIPIGQAEVVRQGRDTVAFWALGPWVREATDLANQIEAETGVSATVVNARFAKPLDTDLLYEQARRGFAFVTFEDHVIHGGFGAGVLEALSEAGLANPVERVAWPDRFVEHGSTIADLRATNGLSPSEIHGQVTRLLRRTGRLPAVTLAAG